MRHFLKVIMKDDVTDKEAEDLLYMIETDHPELVERVERYTKAKREDD